MKWNNSQCDGAVWLKCNTADGWMSVCKVQVALQPLTGSLQCRALVLLRVVVVVLYYCQSSVRLNGPVRNSSAPAWRRSRTRSSSIVAAGSGNTPRDLWPAPHCFPPTGPGASWEAREAGRRWSTEYAGSSTPHVGSRTAEEWRDLHSPQVSCAEDGGRADWKKPAVHTSCPETHTHADGLAHGNECMKKTHITYQYIINHLYFKL